MKNTIKRLQKIDDALFEINKQINLTNLYPINIDEVKEKFFKDEDYNPQFEYSDPEINFKEFYKKIKSLKYKETVMDKLLKDKAKETYYFLKLIESIGKKSFTKYSIKIYGKPNKELLKTAKKLSSYDDSKIHEPKRRTSTYNAVLKFRKIFKELNIKWEVEEKDIASKAMVIPSRRRLLIRTNRNFSRREIRRFIVHEIYAHVLRTEFGLIQPYKIFSIGLAGYESTEEGLALYKEKKAGLLAKKGLKGYSARVLSVDKALNGSFREVYNFLTDLFDKEKAWDLSVRVKRGIKNTGEPGSFTKDILYLKGFLEVNNFIKNQSGLHLLHYGKISVRDALLIPSIEGLNNPFVILKKHFKKHMDKLSIMY